MEKKKVAAADGITTTGWRKSSYTTMNCVEVATAANRPTTAHSTPKSQPAPNQ